MTGHFGEHDFVGGTRVNDKVVTKKDLEEFGAGELHVLPLFVNGFPFSHAFVAFEDDARVHSDINAMVAEFPKEAAVAVVNRTRYHTEVTDVVIEGVTVDMVNGETGRDVA